MIKYYCSEQNRITEIESPGEGLLDFPCKSNRGRSRSNGKSVWN